MSYWYEQLTKIKGNEQCLQWLKVENRKIKINGKVTENFQTDFLNSNDLSVEDFWMVLYFQTLPYGTLEFGSLKQNFDNGR
ncbi:unnamed protein product [Rhizophagus irregularis]|nr:unnamed protein product [Rhizophagus irregularis]